MSLFAIIVNVPRITPARPSLAPALLKSILAENGKASTVVDINIDFWNNFPEVHGDKAFYALDKYFSDPHFDLTPHIQSQYNKWLEGWAERLLEYNTEHIMISVFTWQAHRFTKDILQLLRPKTTAKIVIGGQGIGEIREQTSFIGPPRYAHELKKLGLIDHWIKGDAQRALTLMCQGQYQGPGIDTDTYAEWDDLATLPMPDFDDVDIKQYHSGYVDGMLPIEISRGCVRECNFCDWVTSNGGFRTKTGRQMFNEVINHFERYGCKNFYFVDALMNGSIGEFNKFNRLLIDYYQKHNLPDRHISYSGHFIIRGPHQGWKKEHIGLMGRAGANIMVVGVETGSDRVRTDMNKGYTNADLDYNMQEFVKHGVSLYMLMMVGYPTETEEEFNETKNLLKRYQHYVANGNIAGINFGQTFVIEEGAPIFYHPEHLNLVGVNGSQQPRDVFWMNPNNPELTYKKRIQRRIEIQDYAMKLGYPLWKGDDQLNWLTKKYQEILNGSYNEHQTSI
jgi:anaerobic magnesium-protoporphyrin IX monomethyl ester cyclase